MGGSEIDDGLMPTKLWGRLEACCGLVVRSNGAGYKPARGLQARPTSKQQLSTLDLAGFFQLRREQVEDLCADFCCAA